MAKKIVPPEPCLFCHIVHQGPCAAEAAALADGHGDERRTEIVPDEQE